VEGCRYRGTRAAKILRLEALPDNPRRAGSDVGPLVLAGDLGAEPERTSKE
jgi:hypothetical protein